MQGMFSREFVKTSVYKTDRRAAWDRCTLRKVLCTLYTIVDRNPLDTTKQ